MSAVSSAPNDCLFSSTETSSGYTCIKRVEYPYSSIVFLRAGDGSEVLIKQIKEDALEEQVQMIAELLSGEIGSEVGVCMNSITAIAREEMQEFKPIPTAPAMLLSMAPGFSLEEIDLWSDLELGQRFRPIGSLQYKKYGALPREKAGLTLDVLRCMSKHKDLPAMVALDTFLGNRDRFKNNLFYDPITDRFTAIDFGESFKCSLMSTAKMNLERIATGAQEGPLLSLESLRAFKDTLSSLRGLWPKERIQARMHELCFKHGFEFEGSKKIQLYLKTIDETFLDIDQTLTHLDTLISQVGN